MPVGLQLYTLQDDLAIDFDATLRKVASIGYTEVELPGLFGRTPVELRSVLADAGLRCRSAHLVFLGQQGIESNIAAALELGLDYLVAPIPWKRDTSSVQPDPAGGPHAFLIGMVNDLTLDDWKWNAELLNEVGEQVRMAGLQLLYHNHNFEFKSYGGVIGYDEMLRLSDPGLVKVELDPGWIRIAGYDPMDYLARLGSRVRLLHIRDFKRGFRKSTTLSLVSAPESAVAGAGDAGYDTLLELAHRAGVESYYVEREPAAGNLEAIALDYAYLRDKIR